jgi:hypothetical protein
VETLTALFERGILESKPAGASYRTNPSGQEYMSALAQPDRR